MRVVAVVPAKGSSSRIESKNLKLLDGKPLFIHTIEKLMDCNFIDEVFLDTESQDVISLASETGCSIMRRDPSLSSNATDGNSLFYNEVVNIDADVYIQHLCTSPFISKEKIKEGLDAIINSDFDSAVLIQKEKQYQWSNTGPVYDINNIPNSVDLDDTMIETMGLYIVKKETALCTKRRIGTNPFILESTPLDAIDVNWPEDFDLAELIAAGSREKSRKLLNNIKGHLNSCLLSDLLDDFGYPNQVIKGLSPNINNSKILGRANTLKLRKLEDGEDFKGIYHALKSYDAVIPNDIIMIENETPEYAYFGELNANLAIRSGASGVIVGGKTRDSQNVLNLSLPVYSTGYTCQDVRKRATLDSYGKTINIHGVTVAPGSLIFADSEGVVVIPKEVEEKVIDLASKSASNESNILIDISKGVNVDLLTERYGFF